MTVYILKGKSYDEGADGFYEYDWIIGVYSSKEKLQKAMKIVKKKYSKEEKPVDLVYEEKTLDAFLV